MELRDEPLIDRLLPLIDQGRWGDLRETLERLPVADVADAMRELPPTTRMVVFRMLPHDRAADVFAELETHFEDEILGELTREETRRLLAEIAPDDRTELFGELPGQATQKLLNLLSPEDLDEARRFLGYPEESIGRLATPDYVAIRPEWTVAQALDQVRGRGRDSETVNVVYVVDRRWKLLGTISLRLLVLAEPDEIISDIMVADPPALSAFEDREMAVRDMRRYDAVALPVVDSAGVLIGIVTVDDALDVAEEETTEDLHLAASIAPLRTSYRSASVWDLYGRRIWWLAGLLVINLISSGIIAAYEQTLATTVALAFFIPLLIATGGNTGSQSAMLMVRALVTNDLSLSEWSRTLAKELAVGALLGATLAGGSVLLGIFRADARIGLVVGLSMVSIVIFSNLLGALLPFILTRLKMDPAVASSPLITSIADASGLLIYFGLATLIIR
jgi:magnesium transporter